MEKYITHKIVRSFYPTYYFVYSKWSDNSITRQKFTFSGIGQPSLPELPEQVYSIPEGLKWIQTTRKED